MSLVEGDKYVIGDIKGIGVVLCKMSFCSHVIGGSIVLSSCVISGSMEKVDQSCTATGQLTNKCGIVLELVRHRAHVESGRRSI